MTKSSVKTNKTKQNFNEFEHLCLKCFWYGKPIECPAEYDPDKPFGKWCKNFKPNKEDANINEGEKEMTERERLIELMQGYTINMPCERAKLADHLLNNGVIVPPVKVGDKVKLNDMLCCVNQIDIVRNLDPNHCNMRYYATGVDDPMKIIVFDDKSVGTDIRVLTKEEAERELERRKNNEQN